MSNTQMNARRRRRFAVTLLLLASLLLLLMAGALSLGKAYHLTLDIDTERLSPTVAGADARTGLQLVSQLHALSMDEDIALPDLFDTSSALGTRFGSAASVSDTVQGIMDYLGSYDARLGSDRSLLQQISALLSMVDTAKTLLVLLAAVELVLLAIGAGLFFSGHSLPAGLLLGLDALLLGCLPPGILSAAQLLGKRFAGALAVAARYGVGFSATLRLTAAGRTLVFLCAGVLLLCAFAMLFGSQGRRRIVVSLLGLSLWV